MTRKSINKSPALNERERNLAFACFRGLIIAAFVAAVFFSVPISADFGWPDAGRHAMDGMFYRDLIVDGGYTNPLHYALKYYLHYPAITPVLYPPFFSFCEILGFTLIGPYPWVARLTVAVFLLLGAVGITRLTENLLGKTGAFYAALFYVAMPAVIFWGRDVMLEVPAMAIVIWSFYFFRRYLKEGGTKDLIYCLILATLAPYTKQNTIFIFGVFAVAALISGNAVKLTDRRFIGGLMLVGLCGIPLAYVTFRWGTINFEQSFGNLKPAMSIREHFVYYFRMLPGSVGWPIILLAAAGFFSIGWKRSFKDRDMKITLSILVSWALICYLQMGIVKVKEPRHAFFWLPVFAILGASAVERVSLLVPWKIVRTAVSLAVICGLFTYHLAEAKMNWSEGFKLPARYVVENWEGHAVLTNIYGDASFIFHVRALDQEKKFRVYRLSKIFESRMIYKEWGVNSQVESSREMLASFGRYGIRLVLVENPMEDMTQVEKMLRKVCSMETFQKIHDFTVVYPDNRTKTLTLFRYGEKINTVKDTPVLHLPVIGIRYKD